jgi:hypothetical protein
MAHKWMAARSTYLKLNHKRHVKVAAVDVAASVAADVVAAAADAAASAAVDVAAVAADVTNQ